MKKITLVILTIINVFLFTNCAIVNQQVSSSERNIYYYKINSLIKDEDFSTAKIEESKIILYNEKREMEKEIIFDEYDKRIPVLYIRKDENLIFFVEWGIVDDEGGIVFMNNELESILDGIYHIDRIDGNYFKYSTMN